MMQFPMLTGTLAEVTRNKPIELRSKEEHQWVSLDVRLHLWLYLRDFKPFHDMGLCQSDIQRLWNLPSLLQLAFRFITNDVELEAHRTLNQYYDRPFIDKCPFDSSSRKMDKEIVFNVSMQSIGTPMNSIMDLTNVMNNRDLAMTLSQIMDHDRHKRRENGILEKIIPEGDLENIQSHLKSQSDPSLVYVQDNQCIQIVHDIADDIQEDKLHRYQFEIENDYMKKLGSIVVTIIFQGSFCDSDYSPGRLSAALYRVNNNDQIENVGIAEYHLQSLNTTKGIGRLVIEYQSQTANDNETLFLDILASSTCHYSITLSGRVNYQLHAYAITSMCRFYTIEKEIQSIRLEIDSLKLDSKLRESSISILEDLIDHANSEKENLYEDILKSEYQLEADDSIDYFVVENKIRTQEREYSRQERIRQVRVALIQSMADQNVTVAEQMSILESTENEKSHYSSILRHWLPCVFAHDELSCTKVQFEVNKQYEMRDILIESAIKAAHLLTKDEMNVDTNANGRAILREIARSSRQFTKLVESSFLHQSTQLYPKDYLIDELQRHLKVLLVEDIRRKEALHPLLVVPFDGENDTDTFIDTFDSDNLTGSDMEESEETELHHDELYCPVCQTIPCKRVDVGNFLSVQMERETLTNSIMDLRREKVKLSKKDPQSHKLEMISQSILSLQNKATALDVKIKLEDVDKELHDILKSNQNGYFVVRSLHQYDCLMEKDAAITALEKEHDCLVAYQSAKEILDDILCRMEEGWIFGETMQQEKSGHSEDKCITQIPPTQHELISHIHRRSHLSLSMKQSLKRRRNLTSFLDSIEKSIRIGLVCWLIRYFRAMAAIKCQKGKPAEQDLPSQRIEMIREEEMAKERNSRRIGAYEKARTGSLRINRKNQHRVEINVRGKIWEEKTNVLKETSAVIIQKHYRRYLGKKVFCLWKSQRESILAWNALCHASATAISRYWRGYVARDLADRLRSEMVNYLLNMRKKEVEQDEEEYWNSLKFGKYRRQRYTFNKRREKQK